MVPADLSIWQELMKHDEKLVKYNDLLCRAVVLVLRDMTFAI